MPVRRVFWILFLLFLPLLVLGCKMDSEPVSEPVTVVDTFDPQTFDVNDTYLTLYDSGDNVLAEDDNGNPDQSTPYGNKGCSRIIIVGGLQSGTYYIKVHNPDPGGMANPNYAIRVLEYQNDNFPTVALPVPLEDETETSDYIDNDAAGNRTTPVSIGLGDVVVRTVYPRDTDVDWFVLVIP
jgi:hypothetical protein